MSDEASSTRSAFEATTARVAEMLHGFGDSADEMAALYDYAITVADTLQGELRRRGKATSDRETLEQNLLMQWLQLAEQFASQYLGITIQQAAQIVRAPKGPRLADVREMLPGPDRGRLR